MRDSYSQLLQAVASHFSSAASRAKAANELENRVRKPTESLLDFSVVLQRLVQEAKPHWNILDTTVDEYLRDKFMRALGDIEMSMFVKRQCATTFAGAVEIATQYEEAKVFMKGADGALTTTLAPVRPDTKSPGETGTDGIEYHGGYCGSYRGNANGGFRGRGRGRGSNHQPDEHSSSYGGYQSNYCGRGRDYKGYHGAHNTDYHGRGQGSDGYYQDQSSYYGREQMGGHSYNGGQVHNGFDGSSSRGAYWSRPKATRSRIYP